LFSIGEPSEERIAGLLRAQQDYQDRQEGGGQCREKVRPQGVIHPHRAVARVAARASLNC
jgi:hypothetical protein